MSEELCKNKLGKCFKASVAYCQQEKLAATKELKAEGLLFDSSIQEIVKMKACGARDGSSNIISKELFTG